MRQVEAVKKMADIEEEMEEEGEATERAAKPSTPEATSAVHVHISLACRQRDAAPLRRGSGDEYCADTSPGGEGSSTDSSARWRFGTECPHCSFCDLADSFAIGVGLWVSTLRCLLLPRCLGQVGLPPRTLQNGCTERIQANTE